MSRRTLPIGQLSEGHRQILIPAGEASQPQVALITLDATTPRLFPFRGWHRDAGLQNIVYVFVPLRQGLRHDGELLGVQSRRCLPDCGMEQELRIGTYDPVRGTEKDQYGCGLHTACVEHRDGNVGGVASYPTFPF